MPFARGRPFARARVLLRRGPRRSMCMQYWFARQELHCCPLRPKRRFRAKFASYTANASVYRATAGSLNPLASCVIESIRSRSPSGRPTYVFQHAHPSAHRTMPWYCCLHRPHVCHRSQLSFFALPLKLFSSASSYKIFACRAKHDTCATPSSGEETPSRSPHAHPRTRPSPVREWTASRQM